MSRRSDLMDKPLTYRTLSDLIFDFEDSYKKYLHSVKKVKIGLYVPHEPHSFQPIEWKQLVLNVSKMMRTEVRKELEKFARDMRMKGAVAQFAFRNDSKRRWLGRISVWLGLELLGRVARSQRDQFSVCAELWHWVHSDSETLKCPFSDEGEAPGPAVLDKKGDLATLNEVGYQLRI
ncbi:vasohibin 2 [Turdus rufiventris]|nr:vasohibin 2 [Turdus rufiventris]